VSIRLSPKQSWFRSVNETLTQAVFLLDADGAFTQMVLFQCFMFSFYLSINYPLYVSNYFSLNRTECYTITLGVGVEERHDILDGAILILGKVKKKPTKCGHVVEKVIRLGPGEIKIFAIILFK
jgi:hypothetical protein